MKTLISIIFIFLLIMSCKKEYKCVQKISIEINGIIIDSHENIIYSNECLTGKCFNYQEQKHDTIINSKTNCK
jgi:hypothetical protein